MKYFLLFILLTSLSCVKEKQLCQTPPPVLGISLVNSANQIALSESNFNSLKISYTANGSKAYIADLKLNHNPTLPGQYYATSYSILKTSQDLNTPNFTLEFNGQVVGSMLISTFEKDTECDKWTYASEVSLNGQAISQNANGTYSFIVND